MSTITLTRCLPTSVLSPFSFLHLRIPPSLRRFPSPLFSTSINSRYNPTMSTATVSAIEAAKKAAGTTAVANHYPKDAKYVGIGSGSTIVYVVEAIKEAGIDTSSTKFVPTGFQSKELVKQAGLQVADFDTVPEGTVLDVAFDGADEVDDELNLIKGGGACLFQEKIVALQAKEFIVVADSRKLQSRLLEAWKYIPIEVAPIAVNQVLAKLKELGSIQPYLRMAPLPHDGPMKEGPLKTDQDFFIIDAPFKTLLTRADVAAGKGDGNGKDGLWEVDQLARTINEITGVLEVGIFSGVNGPQARARGLTGGQKPVAAYFGMTDGTVQTRKASQ